MHIKNEHIQNGLLVISGKEHGRLFTITDGIVSEFDHLEKHPPEYSDNEGFFIRAGQGERYGSGNPREEDDKRNLERYMNALKNELKAVITELKPETLFIIEPEHLKGKIEEQFKNQDSVTCVTVAYGNYTKSSDEELQAVLERYKNESLDAADPQSVAGEENAEEKRKILETAKLRNS
tara:strand:+ start:204 stop:740 length:537 start_codon:yes stop_codon:yes gene_type:complete